MPYPGLLHPEPLPLWQSTADPYLRSKHSNTVLSQSLLGLWVLVHTRYVWALLASLVGMGLILNMILPLLLSFWGFSFALGHGVSPQSCSNAAQPLLQNHRTYCLGDLFWWLLLSWHLCFCMTFVASKFPTSELGPLQKPPPYNVWDWLTYSHLPHWSLLWTATQWKLFKCHVRSADSIQDPPLF